MDGTLGSTITMTAVGANGKFVLRNSNDLAQLAEAVMNGRQVHFEFHCSDGLHIVDSWRWRYP